MQPSMTFYYRAIERGDYNGRREFTVWGKTAGKARCFTFLQRFVGLDVLRFDLAFVILDIRYLILTYKWSNGAKMVRRTIIATKSEKH